MNILTDSKIDSLAGIGQKRAKLYEKLGLYSIYDLLYYLPDRYMDCSDPTGIFDAKLGEKCCVRAKILGKERPFVGSKKTIIYKVHAMDSKKNPFSLIFFNDIYSFRALNIEQTYLFFGKIDGDALSRKIINPKIISDSQAGLIPIYPLTAGLTSKMISSNIKQAIKLVDKNQDNLPKNLTDKYKLNSFKTAIQNIHFPKSEADLNDAKRRLIFEELLYWQLGICILKQEKLVKTEKILKCSDISDFLKNLPFKLTKNQQSVIEECVKDCFKQFPMNRLIQGDVGCGKTVVAAALAFLFSKSKMQTAVMAPTDILARQHFNFFYKILSPLGIRVELLVGALNQKAKLNIQINLKNGTVDVIIGTHALFQEKTNFKNLGLVITDEQHRFGVEQRKKLAKKGDSPHNLVMSATPIPRTLALIIYGDLDISNIHEMPAGRKPIQTVYIPSYKRDRAFSYIKNQLQMGHQAYIVCPSIEDSDKNISSVLKYASDIQKNAFNEYSVEALHGKMTGEQKAYLMQKFSNNEINILVSTTVIEVGVNVPNATVMMIENAESFGLSQLHQLRGRVGRGEAKSLCILVSDALNLQNQKRLQTMCETNDGFKIAEEDLKIRGPGDFFGKRQHGMPDLKVASLIEDTEILKICQEEAKCMTSVDPGLNSHENIQIKQCVKRLFSNNIQIL